MSGYEAGTVAVATVRGVLGVRVFRNGGGWWSLSKRGSSGQSIAYDSDVTDVRPLVVLDPDELYESEPGILRHWGSLAAENHLTAITQSLRGLADAIEEQTRPPKPPEPTGLGAVVRDRQGHVWCRIHESYGDFLWRMEVPNTAAEKYANIDAVYVLSEGVA